MDAALLIGPLYELVERCDRALATYETYRLLKPKGLVFAAFITCFAPPRDIANKDPLFNLEQYKRFESIVQNGDSKADSSGRYPDFYFSKLQEIAPFLDEFGSSFIGLFACEGVIATVEKKVNELDGEAWEAWLSLATSSQMTLRYLVRQITYFALVARFYNQESAHQLD